MSDFLDELPPPFDDGPARSIESKTGRTPPHNIQVEQSLLGVMLLSRDAIANALEVVEAAHFYRPAHQHIFDAITTLYGAGDEADVVTVGDLLDRNDLLQGMGGPAMLLDLQSQAPAVTGAKKYAQIVRENATLRRLISVGNEIAEIAYDLSLIHI